MSNEVAIDLTLNGVGSLKSQLKQLKAAIAEASDPAQMDALAKKAGEVSDRIKDANDAVNVFASGSKFEQISSSFGGIKDSIMSLDFEEASQKAQTFQKVMGGIGKADISGAIKGITKTVSTLGATFVRLGVQILMNPIFLLAAVITAIIVAIVLFLKKIGVLDKVMQALMLPINILIAGFKELTDWLGLTSFAAEENAEKIGKANEKAIESSKKRTAAIGDQYDIEIARAKAAGKDTTQLELDKSKALEKEAIYRRQKAQEEYAALNKVANADNAEKRKKLREQITAENDIIKAGRKDRALIAIADDAEQKAKEDAAKEKAKADREARAKAYKDGEKAIQAEIATANKLVVDSTKTQSQKEIDDTIAKYDKLIAEAKKYKQNITTLEAAKTLEVNNIRKAEAANEETVQIESAASAITRITATNTQKLQLQGEANMASFEDLQKYNAEVKAADEALADAKIGAVKGTLDAIGSLAGENKKVANALFLVDKALAIGQVIVNTQKEISAYASNPTWSLLPDGGAALKTAAIAGAKIRAATSIGTIVATSIGKFMNGGGGGTVGGGGNVTAPSASTPSAQSSVPSFTPGNLFGQGNNQNNVGGAQDTNTNITVTAVVSETEMTATQNNILKIQKSAQL
jgi:VIT1/CCC1 family predicted Fe2+/Mn2+ transporter